MSKVNIILEWSWLRRFHGFAHQHAQIVVKPLCSDEYLVDKPLALQPGGFPRRNDIARAQVIQDLQHRRVLHHAITINIRGNSYRLKDKLKAGLIRASEPAVT